MEPGDERELEKKLVSFLGGRLIVRRSSKGVLFGWEKLSVCKVGGGYFKKKSIEKVLWNLWNQFLVANSLRQFKSIGLQQGLVCDKKKLKIINT